MRFRHVMVSRERYCYTAQARSPHDDCTELTSGIIITGTRHRAAKPRIRRASPARLNCLTINSEMYLDNNYFLRSFMYCNEKGKVSFFVFIHFRFLVCFLRFYVCPRTAITMQRNGNGACTKKSVRNHDTEQRSKSDYVFLNKSIRVFVTDRARGGQQCGVSLSKEISARLSCGSCSLYYYCYEHTLSHSESSNTPVLRWLG